MLHAGLDLWQRRLDVCLVDDAGELVARIAAALDAEGLRHLARRVQVARVLARSFESVVQTRLRRRSANH